MGRKSTHTSNIQKYLVAHAAECYAEFVGHVGETTRLRKRRNLRRHDDNLHTLLRACEQDLFLCQIQQNAAWEVRGYEHVRRCAHAQVYARAGIHANEPRAAAAAMSRPSWSPWPTSQPSFHWPCLSALVAAAVCACMCVCNMHIFKRATMQRAHTHAACIAHSSLYAKLHHRRLFALIQLWCLR